MMRKMSSLGAAVRRVLDVLPDLVAHHVALPIELLLRHRAAEVFEAVGIEPQQRRQQRRGPFAEVVGAILGGRRVVGATAGSP
jgi:hypothetical protein